MIINIYFLVVHSRSQAVGMWQALLEEGAIVHGRENFFVCLFVNSIFIYLSITRTLF